MDVFFQKGYVFYRPKGHWQLHEIQVMICDQIRDLSKMKWLFRNKHSGDSWMYPDPNVPRHGKSLYKPYLWVFSSPRIPSENTINTVKVHVR